MGKRIWILGSTILIALALGAGAAFAKPADLPVPSQPECADEPEHGSLSITFDLLTGRITVELAPTVEAPMAIDAFCPALLQALFEELVAQAGNALVQPRCEATAEEKLAEKLFRAAEQFAQQGQLENARRCYQQAHLHAPTSRAGRKAIERLQQIEERMRDAAEESSEPPSPPLDPEALYRSIRDRTIPLGLVFVSY